ncbi:Peptidase M16 inactive domain protein [Planctomycetes bacterium Pan216]|uniref:Peptidase M16 inactive domain protein n=1 Tax=Kolteria novifilia TaxID=2527975 RepID=A0A518BCE6_9BACT|nr:Peptidase M16 inactive domain protein [Planctomycetes bacterium Pan216]
MTRLAAFCFGLLFVASSAFAQEKAPPVEHRAATTVSYSSKEDLGKGITLAKMTNGLTVIVQENHAAPLATARAYVKNTGGAFEGRFLGAGISHLVEHLVAGGSTTKRSEDEIQAIVDSLGGRTNAFTSNNLTAYFIDSPGDKVDSAIELVADMMQYAAFNEEEYRREMEVVQRELEMGESERSRVGYQRMKELVYTVSPMRVPIIGYLSVLQKITRDDVVAFYRSRYVPQNIVFVVVGDVDTKAVLASVLENFKEFRRSRGEGPVLPEEPLQISPRSVAVQMEGDVVDLSLAFPTVPLQDPDLYALDVASFILARGDSSRLAKRLKIDKPLATSVSSSSYTPDFVRGWFDVSATFTPENMDEIQGILLEELDRLISTPVEQEELAKAKRQMAAAFVFGNQTVQDQANSLGRNYLSTGDPTFDEEYLAGIEGVTAEQVQAVAKKYISVDRMNTVMIEPIGSSLGTELANEESPNETPVVAKTLPNGLTVLVKRNGTAPLVTMQAFVKGGVIADTAKTSGLASLTASTMEKGTEKFTGEQIANYFDSIGGQFSVNSQRNSSYLQCTVLKEDFAESFDYLFEVYAKPTFPKEQFEKVKALQLAQIAARGSNPQAEIMDFFATKVPDALPYSRTVMGTKETVASLTDDDCRKLHATYFVPNNTVLAIFGDIDPEKTMSLVESTFGSLQKSESFSWPKFPEQAPKLDANKIAHLTNQKKNTALVLVAYPTSSIYDEKDRASIEMLQSVLTGGLGARLYGELRGEGLVYYVFGFQLTGFAPGYFVFLAQTRPETADEVIERIQASLKKIEKEGIPQKEFDEVRDKMITSHSMKNQTATSQAFQAAIDELYGLGYDFDRSYPERLKKATPEDVVDVVKKYFQHAIILTASPTKAASPKAN